MVKGENNRMCKTTIEDHNIDQNLSNSKTEESTIREISIACRDEKEAFKIGEQIHNQLKGNSDYIDNNIILNCTDFDNIVKIWIFKECESIPEITI